MRERKLIGKDLEGNSHHLTKVLYLHFPGGTEEKPQIISK
jgi:hypothetical protein